MNKWLLLILLSTPLFGAEADLQKLVDGNARYLKGHVEPKSHTQKPFAVIVACSDSRVAPEIIFDQGLGDLFVVRVAGNVVGDIEMESINYALDHLGAKVVMVMGHEYCGAVDAVKEGQVSEISAIASLIKPSIKGAKTLEAAVKANVLGVVDHLDKNIKAHIVGAYYDFETGEVEILNGKGS